MSLRRTYEIRDRVTHDRRIRAAFGRALAAQVWRADRRDGRDSPAALLAAIKAARFRYPLAPGSRIERDLAWRHAHFRDDAFPWDAVLPKTAERRVRLGIVLKAPGAHGERGLLYVAFENEFAALVRHADLEALARDYDLLLGPTWSPPYEPALALVVRRWPGRHVFTMLSNMADGPILERLHPRLVSVPVLASSWSDPTLFAPAAPDAPKRHDLIVVSNFSPYKRHHALFAALAAAPRPLRTVVAGVRWMGVTEDTLRQLAAEYGVADQVTFLVNAPDDVLRDAIRASRAGVICSLNEGSCVAAAECLMLGVPLGMFADAHVGSLAFVTAETGRRLRGGRRAGEDLARLVDEAPSLRPREWMLAHGAECHGSTAIVNRVVRERVMADGGRWTEDACVHRFVRLRPEYLTPTDAERFAPHYASFEARYGVALDEPPRPTA